MERPAGAARALVCSLYVAADHNPDLLIYLDCEIETTRRRRNNPNFEAWIYDAERFRLRHAREHCNLYIATDHLSPAAILELALAFVSKHSF